MNRKREELNQKMQIHIKLYRIISLWMKKNKHNLMTLFQDVNMDKILKTLKRVNCVVIAVKNCDTHPEPSLNRYFEYLNSRGLFYPVYRVDDKDEEQITILLQSMMAFYPNFPRY